MELFDMLKIVIINDQNDAAQLNEVAIYIFISIKLY